MQEFDVIVIGGGHAGCEAAAAVARSGGRAALVTLRADRIGVMSCNPAVGGLAKGQITREVDALGGLMGRCADATGIQFRMLNGSKGPAVQSPRAQCDKYAYAEWLGRAMHSDRNITVIEGEAVRVLTDEGARGRGGEGATNGSDAGTPGRGDAGKDEGARGRGGEEATDAPGASSDRLAASLSPEGAAASASPRSGERRSEDPAAPKSETRNPKSEIPRVRGVQLADGRSFRARAVVVTTGTFLHGLMHTGEVRTVGGRIGEPAATGLSASLRELGLELGRLKTGTCPRLAAETVDLSSLAVQPGDAEPQPFSFLNDRLDVEQLPCWITFTNPAVHELIRTNLHRAPLFSGQIKSTGPRYCPSIEDKIVRFAGKEQHQIFLEPEGRRTNEIYCNGIPTSLPADVQERMVHAIRGLERATILRFGYAVEYDWAPPTQIDATLQTKRVAGLFLAGQINGTSGYEEAAGQGIVAGINAARFAAGKPLETIGRDQAYIGVMIDDLVTKGTEEPYRMFTSRAEHRLHLRADNADRRLTPLADRLGIAEPERIVRLREKESAIAELLARLGRIRVSDRTGADLLRRQDVTVAELAATYPALRDARFTPPVVRQVEIETKYSGYIALSLRQIERFRRLEDRPIPHDMDFRAISQLRHEAKEKFARFTPRSFGQAGRISGINPSDLAVLLIHLERRRPRP